MHGFILTIHIIVSLFLIMVILMQQSKGGGLSSVFGGGGGSIFGGRGAAPFLTKTTIVLGAIFVLTSVTLTIMSAKTRTPKTAIEKAIERGEMAPHIEE